MTGTVYINVLEVGVGTGFVGKYSGETANFRHAAEKN